MKKWLENYGIKTTDWSFYLFDLIVIKHIWFKLKEMNYQMCLNIEKKNKSKKKIKNILFDVLEKT